MSEQRTVDILGFLGMDYRLAAGTNRDGRRTIALALREPPDTAFHPVIEMDIDIPSFYRDVEAGLDLNPRKPDREPT